MSDDKRCLNKIWVDQETHDTLYMQANAIGVTIGAYAAGVLDSAVIEKSGGNLHTSDDKLTVVYWNHLRARVRKRSVENVHKTAAMYCSNPTEEGADQLKEMCEGAGLDYKEVVLRAKNDPFSSIVANSRNGTKYGQCINWLPQTIIKQGGRVPVATLRTIASIEGFSHSMLDRVKRAINNDNDTPNILSERESEGWVWALELEEQQQQ